jgi:hypothetical protein
LGEALIGLGKHGSLGPQRIPDVPLAAEEQRLGGAHVRKFLRRENRILRRIPWSRKVYIQILTWKTLGTSLERISMVDRSDLIAASVYSRKLSRDLFSSSSLRERRGSGSEVARL